MTMRPFLKNLDPEPEIVKQEVFSLLSYYDKAMQSGFLEERFNHPAVKDNDTDHATETQRVVPTDTELEPDDRIDQFVIDTYVRFFQRLPTEYEKHYLVDEITDDTLLTPEAIYIAFALSNEYQFY